MSARVIVPAVAELVSSTATSEYSEWASGTAYTIGDRVIVSADDVPTVYEAASDNTNAPPASSPDDWLRVSVSNPHKMLDVSSSSATSNTDGFSATISITGRVTHVALFGLQNAASVAISVTNSGGDPVVWTETDSGASSTDGEPITMIFPRSTSTWTGYFFGGFRQENRALLALAGWINNPQIAITVTGVGPVKLSHIVAGVVKPLGCTLAGVSSSIESFSTREYDQWGTPTLVKRLSAQMVEAVVIANDHEVDALTLLRRDLDAVPAVWEFSDKYRHLRIFAFFENFEIQLDGVNQSYCSIDLLELT